MSREIRIESASNKQIKWLKSLSKRKNRWKEEKFMIEGIRSLEQLLENGYTVDTVIYSNSLKENDRGMGLVGLARDEGYRLIQTTDDIFKSISDTEEPQWIMAVADFKFDTIKPVKSKKDSFFVLLDRVQDPGNLGTIIRTAEAFGADALIITDGCVDIYNPKTVRSSMGAILQLSIVYFSEMSEVIRELKAGSVSIVSSSPGAKKNVYDADLRGDIAVVIGNEGAGISDEVLESSDIKLKIPMVGKAESLNAGVASGILMYEVLRQRIE